MNRAQALISGAIVLIIIVASVLLFVLPQFEFSNVDGSEELQRLEKTANQIADLFIGEPVDGKK